MIRTYRLTYTLMAAVMLWATSQPTHVDAAPLDLADVPLVVSTVVAPNIMFLIDNSGSMSNIVPDDPYNATTTYFTCPSSLIIDPATDSIDVRITSSGDPYFEQGDVDYDWAITAGTGSHGDHRCFDPAQSYDARLYGDAGDSGSTKSPDGYLQAEYTGNYLNWYFGTTPTNWGSGARQKPDTDRRIDIAQTASKQLIDEMQNVRVGLASYNDSSGARINVGVDDLDATYKTTLKTAIDTLTPSGATPLAESLQDIGRYFVQGHNETLTLHPGGANAATKSAYTVFDHTPAYDSGVTQASPIQYFCQKNFSVLITDGRPQDDQDISSLSGLQDYDGDCPNGNDGTTCLDHDQKVGREYESAGSDYLDDVTLALKEMDLRPDLDDFDGNEVTNNMITYTIGFADDQVINDPLMQDTADNGGGLFLTAANASQLTTAFKQAFADIQNKTSSAASVALNAGAHNANSRVYQARFNSGQWSGQLLSRPLTTQGQVLDPEWDTSLILETLHWSTAREIITYDDDATPTPQGLPFRWSNLSSEMQDLVHLDADGVNDSQGEARLEYLRGNKANESSTFRSRLFVQGDLVSSDPFFVGAPPFPDGIGTAYSDFRKALSGRTPMVYVGGNDGMLHGFNATDGTEKLAYVPRAVYDQLGQLSDPDYLHRYFVDGSPTVGDVYGNFGSNRCGASSICWRSVLVSGLRGGGQGFFALDVSDPSTFDESNANKLVLWEFTDEDDPDMGFTFIQPSIVKMANGKWAAVVGNGYNNTESGCDTGGNPTGNKTTICHIPPGSPNNPHTIEISPNAVNTHLNHGDTLCSCNSSTTGHAALYILYLDGGLDGSWTLGTDYIKLDTAEGEPETPNGLATPSAVDIDGDYDVDYIYAGDLRGNLWKFDVSNSDPSQWPNPVRLFQATTGGATPETQPITTRPEAGRHPEDADGVIVYFGTGKYLETTDTTNTGVPTQTFYAVWDKQEASPTLMTRTDLLQQQVIKEVPTALFNTRITTDNAINWNVHDGWYLDLPIEGERQVTDSLLRNNRVIFTTTIPSSDPCSFGGTSWLMELDAFSGSRLSEAPFDLNGDEKFDTQDMVTTTIDGTSETVNVSGVQSTEGLLPSPAVLVSGTVEYKFSSGSAGGVFRATENPGESAHGRQAWRQFQ